MIAVRRSRLGADMHKPRMRIPKVARKDRHRVGSFKMTRGRKVSGKAPLAKLSHKDSKPAPQEEDPYDGS